MADLSPKAQAVLDAYKEASDGHYIDGEWIQDHTGQIAAALRAAADQVVPVTSARTAAAAGKRRARADLLAIAAELEAQS